MLIPGKAPKEKSKSKTGVTLEGWDYNLFISVDQEIHKALTESSAWQAVST